MGRHGASRCDGLTVPYCDVHAQGPSSFRFARMYRFAPFYTGIHEITARRAHRNHSVRLEIQRPKYERPMMSTVDKAKNKAREAKGRVEEAAGKATNDRSRQAKGKKDQASSNLKQASEKVKDVLPK